MAQRFYRKSLPKADRQLPSNQFKQKYPELRDNMKTCILGLFYGMTPRGLADKLQCSESAASAFHGEFKVLFPQLHQWFAETHAQGRIHGYTSTVTNLHRRRGTSGPVEYWERRWFVNHRIQGSAAVIFKMALNRLVPLYQHYDAWLIIPLHDAVVFEAPLEAFEEVTKITARLMRKTLREVFPQLKPRVTVNVSKPTCWNKDVQVTGLSQWLRDNVSQLTL
jgi:DNA polymerase I